MTPRSFVILGALTAVTSGAAVAFSLHDASVATVQMVNEPAFPALREEPMSVARVEIQTSSENITLSRVSEGQWQMVEKHGYPVASDKLRELIVTLSDMRLVESKTRQPARYGRLEVEDIETPGAKSALLRLKTADDEILAEALLGKRSNRYLAGQDKGTYLRRPSDPQVWLASGYTRLPSKSVDWLAKAIVDLPGEKIARVQVSPFEGPRYGARRSAAGSPLSLEDLPEGRKVKAEALGRLASLLAETQLADVKPAKDLELPAQPALVQLHGFDGLEVTARLTRIDEQTWATFEAAYVGDAAAEDEEAKAAREAAAKINERVAGWAYQLESHVAERLTQPLEDLLEAEDKTS